MQAEFKFSRRGLGPAQRAAQEPRWRVPQLDAGGLFRRQPLVVRRRDCPADGEARRTEGARIFPIVPLGIRSTR
jgi:hypothetical protein